MKKKLKRRRPKVWVNVAHSFKEAEEFDIKYYAAMTPAERVADMQFLREQYYLIGRGTRYAKSRKGLRRVVTIVQ